MTLHPAHRRGDQPRTPSCTSSRPRTMWPAERMERAINGIEAELAERLGELEKQGKAARGAAAAHAHHLRRGDECRQVGSCSGIENYSRHIDGRAAGSPRTPCSTTSRGLLLVIDESHVTARRSAPCTKATCPASGSCRARLPAAERDRQQPLTWDESSTGSGQTIYRVATRVVPSLSASGATWSSSDAGRPGLVDPEWASSRRRARSTTCAQIRQRAERDERAHYVTKEWPGPDRHCSKRRPAVPPARGHAAAGSSCSAKRRVANTTCCRHHTAPRGLDLPKCAVASLDADRKDSCLGNVA